MQINRTEGISVIGGERRRDEDGTHCWNWCMCSSSVFLVLGVMRKCVIIEGMGCVCIYCDETVLVKTIATKMKKSCRTYT